MKNPFRTALRLVFLLLAAASFRPATLSAHPYASGLTNAAGTIRFILNESASDVYVVYGNGAATDHLGPLNAGVNSFSLTFNSSTYTNYSIVVSKSGSGLVSQISVDATNNSFFGPRGVAVNRNPKTGNFGRVYVCNANGGLLSVSSINKVTGRGIYIVNADTSDALGRGTNASMPAASWGSSTTYAPFKCFVGPDDMLYVGDASGTAGTTAGEPVWMIDPNVTVSNRLFVSGSNATNNNAGPCASTPFVTGSLAQGNLSVYCLTWNYSAPPAIFNNILQYNIGSGPIPWSNAPIALGNAGSSGVNALEQDLYVAPGGKFFVCQNHTTLAGGNVRVYDTDGTSLLWNSLTAGGGAESFQDVLGIAVSPDNAYVALSVRSGNFLLAHLTNGLPDLATLSTNLAGLGSITRGIAFDAADNLYLVTGGIDRLRVYSLGLSTVTITSNDSSVTNGTFQFSQLASPPAIVNDLQSQSVSPGSTATFSVTASGATPLSYLWKMNNRTLANNAQISGAQSNSLSIASAQNANAGNYQVIVTNTAGAATSSVASLSISALSPFPFGWSQIPNTSGNGARHDDIYFTDSTNGWASQNNNLYHTTNGGLSWVTNLTVGGTHFRSVVFATPQVGFAGNLGPGSYDGNTSNSNILYRTFNGGTNWANVPGFAEAGMRGLCAMFVLDSQHIYGGGRVRGPAYFIKSSDGGTNWTMSSLTDQGVMNGIMDVYFHDQNNGWVCGMDTNAYNANANPPYYGCIAHTTNGGASWFAVTNSTINGSYFWKMSWPTTNIGYCALQQNLTRNLIVFYKTTDGGNTWVSNGIPETTVGLDTNGYHFYFQGLGFISTNEGWIGGASGTGYPYGSSFLHSTDGGATWNPSGFTNTYLINRIRFLSNGTGFASGANLYAYNGGLSLTTQPQSRIVIGPTTVALSVAALGAPNIAYQWQKDGVNAIGATAPTLVLNNVTRTNSGAYSVLVSNPAGAISSSNAMLTVLVPERLSPPSILPGGKLQLVFTDSDGGALMTTNDIASFKVQASTNMFDWTTITNTLSVTNGMLLLEDSWTNAPLRYYRVQENY